jgi:transposase
MAKWAEKHEEQLEIHYLPPYSPDLNPVEWVWKKTKWAATHNRFFDSLKALKEAVSRRFIRYQGNPVSLRGMVRTWA